MNNYADITYEPIDGVGVLHYPLGYTRTANGIIRPNREIAEEISSSIRKGVTICLPSYFSSEGHRGWDFRIERGDPQQVTVERTDNLIPEVKS